MIYIPFVFSFVLLLFASAQSAEAVVLLESSISGESVADPKEYAANLYRIGLGLAAVLAVIMIVWGGIEYIASAANPSSKEDAKKRIWSAIGGLLLALLSVLILQTIDPALVGK